MWLGALAVDVPGGVAFIVSLVAAGAIFLFVRTRGGHAWLASRAAWRTAQSPDAGVRVGERPTCRSGR